VCAERYDVCEGCVGEGDVGERANMIGERVYVMVCERGERKDECVCV